MEPMNFKINFFNLAKEIKCFKLHYLRWNKLFKCLILVVILKEILKQELIIKKILENFLIGINVLLDYLSKIINIIVTEIDKFKVIEHFIIYLKDHIRNRIDLMIALNLL